MNTHIMDTPVCAAPVPASQVDQQLTRLDSNCQQLFKLIEEVKEALAPIIKPQKSSGDSAKEVGGGVIGMSFDEELCPIADSISRRANDVTQAFDMLQKFISKRGV